MKKASPLEFAFAHPRRASRPAKKDAATGPLHCQRPRHHAGHPSGSASRRQSRLTTTRIAARAGVSVGTLYQYFPNKAALLYAILELHLCNVATAVEQACVQSHGASLHTVARGIVTAFVQAKFGNIDASVSLYAVADDLDRRHLAQSMYTRIIRAMTATFRTIHGHTIANPALVATTLLSAMTGISRAMLEPGIHPNTRAIMQTELTTLACAYLQASATPAA